MCCVKLMTRTTHTSHDSFGGSYETPFFTAEVWRAIFFPFPLFICQILAFFTLVNNESQQLDRKSCWLLSWIDNHKQPKNTQYWVGQSASVGKKNTFCPPSAFGAPITSQRSDNQGSRRFCLFNEYK